MKRDTVSAVLSYVGSSLDCFSYNTFSIQMNYTLCLKILVFILPVCHPVFILSFPEIHPKGNSCPEMIISSVPNFEFLEVLLKAPL